MPNTRMATDDANVFGPVFQGVDVRSTVILINGNGAYTNAPALEQDASYPMSNVLTPDRLLPWRTSASPPNAVKLDIDLGTSRTVSNFIVHGLRKTPPVLYGLGSKPDRFTVSYRTSGAGYDGNGAFTTFASAVSTGFDTPHDFMAEDLATKTMRYVRFTFDNAAGGAISAFSVGRLFGGTPNIDFGMIYSPGSTESLAVNRVVTDTAGSAPVQTFIGDDYREFSIRVEMMPSSLKVSLEGLCQRRIPSAIINYLNLPYEVILDDATFTSSHRWKSSDDFYDAALQLRALP